jgi:DNA-binding response OmpR family regulator
MRLLILEDSPKDLQLAEDAARAEGFDDIEAFTSIAPAMLGIEQAMRGEKPMPAAAIIDLDLGSESGYEFLRLCYRKLARSGVHILVWSQLEERNREICALFEVDAYIPKWEGEAALREALRELNLTGLSA